MTTPPTTELDKANKLKAREADFFEGRWHVHLNASEASALLLAANHLKELKKENDEFRQLLTPLKDCPQCRGGGWIMLSEGGGVPAPCDCWSATKIQLDKQLSKLRTAYKEVRDALNNTLECTYCERAYEKMHQVRSAPNDDCECCNCADVRNAKQILSNPLAIELRKEGV